MSLAKDLRAIRGGIKWSRDEAAQAPEGPEDERPWQADIDRLQQNLQEVLQAISRLSGVELPNAGADSRLADGSLPPLDAKTLKDRIRSDLEAFSITTATQISKQAEDQTRTALGAIQNEVSSQIDRVTEEFRERLQGRFEPERIGLDLSKQTRDRVAELVEARTEEFARWVWLVCKGTGSPIPMQIEKLLEPYVEEASAKFEGVIRERVQEQLAQQKQLIQERLQETIGSVEGQISTLEQAAQQICERNADSVTKLSTERLNAAAEETAKGFASKISNEAEVVAGRFQTRLEEIATASQEGMRREGERQAEGFRQKLEGVAGEVEAKKMSEISGRIEETAAVVIESSVQHLHQQTHEAAEHSKEEMQGFLNVQMEEVRGQVKELGQSVHESLSQDAARVADSLKGLDEELSSIRSRHLVASQEQLSGMIQTMMESLTGRLRQITDAQLEEIGRLAQESQIKAASQYESQLQAATEGRYNDLVERLQKEAGEAGTKVAAEIKANSESVMQELSDRVDASAALLREEGIQASTRIESSLRTSLGTCKQQLAQISEANVEAHRQAISNGVRALRDRLERSLQILRGEVEEHIEATR
jgi:hypothetical protein